MLARGLTPVLSGRDPERLRTVAAEFSEPPVRPATLGDPSALTRALAGAAAVVNCAGPFGDTLPRCWTPVAGWCSSTACSRSGRPTRPRPGRGGRSRRPSAGRR
ncbi:hypothetical protein FL583_06890 [Cryptosporangium phraense]|uniref:Saccharopine dehydrogenase NADP binding domain-containing protein n=1 Tax=Cryptosporangium phraense TaxID=2593070 RepID=A0A545AY32_9ACTN|nr:hypothetical protein FL583_06890 [Cryptosporangium phraense]